jgi:integrase
VPQKSTTPLSEADQALQGLTKRQLDLMLRSVSEEQRLWDNDPRGFGARIKPSGVATFFVQYTSPLTGRKTRFTIGQYGRLTVEEARKQARILLGRVARGEDPGQERQASRTETKLKARTIAEFCDQYLVDAEAGLVTYHGRPKRASTLAIDRGRVARHIKPLIGSKLIATLTPTDVEAFFHAVRQGKTAATVKTGPRGLARVTGGATTAARTVGLLGSLFSYAIRLGLRSDNPVARFERPPVRRRDRALAPDEYRSLGEVLTALAAEGANPSALAAVRALALTGCRRSEILTLRRDRIDAHRQVLRLSETKTGPQLRPIGRAVLECLASAPPRYGNPHVFPASRGEGPMVGVNIFGLAAKRAGLREVSLHTLRHSFASTALSLGYSELTIAGLLGHRIHSVTARYAHHVDRSLIAAADIVADRIAAALDGCEASEKAVQIRA